MGSPHIILMFSGKRKSGKDFICEKLKMILEEKCAIIRISAPLKCSYAETHNLDIKELMSDGPYKEKYRLDMIKWSDKIREEDPGYFCKKACDDAEIKPVWIVTDIRRKSDIKWFKETYKDKIKTVRISAELETRKNRGWIFQNGVDDVASECDLDDWVKWNLEVKNDSEEELEDAIEKILNFVAFTLS
ncbi:phosphomevalonate kinase [Anoplophora glabripennis]|uniref:phosphomevalonate kinase n=1 Tax=Anoplophora glabripennis TaxID=217634 RepID=UPI000873E16F|nr:phosphomevalonate kinase [Anoplophora glabripennis]